MRLLNREIRLEASSFCQLKCPSCPTATRAIHPAIGSGFLKLADFEKLLKDSPWLMQIELSNYGEVFLNPHLLDILEAARRSSVAITIINGANLNNARDGVLEGLVKYQVRELTCSIDGASRETYAEYRVGGDFDAVIANIRRLNEFKRQYRSELPQLKWQFIVFGHNEHEIPLARQMANELGMKFETKLSFNSAFSPVRDVALVKRETGLKAATREEYRRVYGTDYKVDTCHQMWTDPQVNWDGKVLGCCRNFWGDFGANAFSDGLVNALNSEKMQYARAMLKGETPERADIPCTTCDIYQWRREHGQWVAL
ncbi:MAG TPA: SPASM domain-containing protein [Candidatus Cybelea sp.]|nr:SPASM domain-containing protein [Candidatus Cybelea sp.]